MSRALLDPARWAPADGAGLTVREPATDRELTRVAAAVAADVPAAAAHAGRAQVGWSVSAADERAGILRRVAALMDEHGAELVEWIVRETGGAVAKATGEVAAAQAQLRHAEGLARQPRGELLAADGSGRTGIARRVPLGVVAVITPWNFPLSLAMRSVAPALALGNAVMLKPDPRTPVTGGHALARLFERAGLPEGLLQVLPGGAELGEALVTEPAVGGVSFTGSSASGRRVGELAGRELKKVALELGGNNVLIVLDDADVDAAGESGAAGSFMHQGQVCMATGRHLVHESVAEPYAQALCDRAAALKVADPAREPDADLGPLIDSRQHERVSTIVADSVDGGARVRVGGRSEDPYYWPTVLEGVTPAMPAFTEEVFGPVAPLTTFSTEEQALELAHSSDFGLAAAIHTRSPARGMELAGRLRAGMVHVNDQTIKGGPGVPFGGMGASGNGSRFGGPAASEAFTEWQWVTVP